MCTKIYKDKERDNDCTTLLLMTNITKFLGIKKKKEGERHGKMVEKYGCISDLSTQF